MSPMQKEVKIKAITAHGSMFSDNLSRSVHFPATPPHPYSLRRITTEPVYTHESHSKLVVLLASAFIPILGYRLGLCANRHLWFESNVAALIEHPPG